MSTALGEPCPKCQKAPLLRFSTDGNGRHVEEVERGCECAAREAEKQDRKRRGVCQDCPAPVCGTIGKAERCEKHRVERARMMARENERKRRANPTAEERRRRRAYERRWRAKNREKLHAYNTDPTRKERLAAYARAQYPKAGTPEYEEARKKHRAKYLARREKAIAYAREHYRKNRERILAEKREGREIDRRKRQLKRQAVEQQDRKAA